MVAAVQAYVDPATSGKTVEINGKIYVVGDGLGDGVANLGAHFTATAADSVNIKVKFKAILASGKSVDDAVLEVTEALKAYFKDLVMNTAIASDIVIRITSVGAIIAGASSVIDYSDLTLNGDTVNIFPGDDGVPVVSEVIVNVDV